MLIVLAPWEPPKTKTSFVSGARFQAEPLESLFPGQPGQGLADRVADHPGLARPLGGLNVGQGLGKGQKQMIGLAAHEPVEPAGHGVGFVDRNRRLGQPQGLHAGQGHHRRSGGVTAGGQEMVRLEPPDYPDRLDYSPGDIKGELGKGDRASRRGERGRGDEMNRQPRLGNDLFLDPALDSDKQVVRPAGQFFPRPDPWPRPD